MNYTTKDTILELSQATSNINGTTLITIGVLPNTNMGLISKQCTDEMAELNNIKDHNIKNALKTSWKSLHKKVNSLPFQSAPSNGLVLIAGEIESCL